MSNRNPIKSHDIFLSYRREGGVDLASRIKEFLEKEGYSAFMDIEDLKSGPFNVALYKKIENAKDFVVVLTKGCLDRCANEDDWLRTEIAYAIKLEKNIIPVMAGGFQMPHLKELPPEINDLPNYHGLNAYDEFFEESMAKLASKFLISQPEKYGHRIFRKNKKKIRYGIYIAVFAILSLYLIANHNRYFDRFYSRIRQSLSISGSDNSENSFLNQKKNTNWFMQTTEGPTPRSWFSIAYDPDKKYTLLHGGFGVDYSLHQYVRGGAEHMSETWAWKDNNWGRMPDKSLALSQGAMAYDKRQAQMILFGGVKGGSRYILSKETWTWSGETWKRLSDTGPDARHSHAIVFDEKRQKVILFGGTKRQTQFGRVISVNEVPLGDTWEWDGIKWACLQVKGPEPRWGHKMVYDAEHGTVVLFGGYDGNKYYNDTWTWDGAKALWSKASSTQAPPARYSYGMVYDSAKSVILLFGGKTEGDTAVNDLWEWNGADWHLIELHASPAPRFDLGMVYDMAQKTTIIYGGSNGKDSYQDTWKLTFE